MNQPGPNLKAEDFFTLRIMVEDAADGHFVTLDVLELLAEIFLLSAPTPFVRSEAHRPKRAAAEVIELSQRADTLRTAWMSAADAYRAGP